MKDSCVGSEINNKTAGQVKWGHLRQQVQAVVPPHRVQQWSVASPQGIAHGSQSGSLLVGSAGASLSWVPWPPASSPPCQTSHSPDDRPIQHSPMFKIIMQQNWPMAI